MAGFGRRNKPLKAGAALVDVDGVSLDSLANGDLLVYDSVNEAFLNTKTLTGSYTISAGLTSTTLTTSGNVTFGGALSLAGNATLAGALAVTGSTSLAAISGTTLSLSGAATLADALTVSGTLLAMAADFVGDVSVEGAFTVFGGLATFGEVSATTLDLAGLLTSSDGAVFGSDVSIAGTLSVSGTISTGSAFSASGLGSSGTLTASGATTLNSTLSVSGAATLASTLAVTGATALTGALTGSTAAFTGTVRSEGVFTSGTTAGVHMELDTDETIWYNGATRLGEVGMTTGSVWYVHLGATPENAIVATKDGSVDLYYNNSKTFETISGGAKTTGTHQITGNLDHDGSNVGFYNTAPTTKQTVSGSRGGNAALASLLTGLAAIGLITDSSSA